METVKTQNGLVQGTTKRILDKDIAEFLQIPYCKPPVKGLRFQKPQHFDNDSENIINKLKFETCFPQTCVRIFDGTNEGEERWIPKDIPDENSLYLNIWCPLNILHGQTNHPVVVWIHGGSYMTGSSSMPIYNGSILSSHENIIVVSINYRLGIFGFLYLDDKLAEGNQGIWDQIFALQWIHKNISLFKGDPNNITILGNSVGGCSVSLHLLINKSWQYFSKAMIHSGVCLSDWGLLPKEEIYRRSEILVNEILHKFQFPLKWDKTLDEGDKKSIITFLQNLNFKDILDNSELYAGIFQCAWTPFIDGDLISDNPRHLFGSEKFKKCPTIILNAENELDQFILYEFPKIKVDRDNMIDKSYFEDSFKYYPHYPIICTPEIKDDIKNEYNINEEKLSIKTLDKILSEQLVFCDAIDLAKLISRSNKQIYYLLFRTRTENDYWPKWCGVLHGDEIPYLFGHALIKESKNNDSEKRTSVELMRQVGHFMRNGSLSKEIPFFDELSNQFTAIDGEKWNVEKFPDDLLKKTLFWNKLREKYV